MTASVGHAYRVPQRAGRTTHGPPRARSSHDRRRLALFLLLSAGAHALLLGQRPPYSPERAAVAPESMLHVTLTSERQRAPAPAMSAGARKAQKPERRPPAVATPRAVEKSPVNREDVVAATPDNETTTRSAETAYARPQPNAATEIPVSDDGQKHESPLLLEARPDASGNDRSPGMTEAAMEAAIRGLLLRDLARHFQYPPLARRAGWEGTVLLSVTLNPNGVLAAVRVERSSGHQILDRAAADTLRRVGRIQEAARWLQGQTLELLLPIVYRLTD